jgi:K+-sensing histidine kinase KdpD
VRERAEVRPARRQRRGRGAAHRPHQHHRATVPRDHGPGPGHCHGGLERIFEPFFTGSKGGTGLGLFIARELAQCNRAALIYEPRAGGGSIFRVVFADPQRWEIS